MAQVLLLSDAPDDALPSLELLNHRVRAFPSEASSIVRAPNVDITLIDARKNLAHARSLCQLVKSSMLSPHGDRLRIGPAHAQRVLAGR